MKRLKGKPKQCKAGYLDPEFVRMVPVMVLSSESFCYPSHPLIDHVDKDQDSVATES